MFDKDYLNYFGQGYFPITIWSKLYRKSVIDKAMRKTKLCSSDYPFVGEDHYFGMNLFPFANSMYLTDEPVYYYRYGGLSSSRFSPSYPSLFVLSDERLSLLDHYQMADGYRSLYVEYCNTVYYHAQQLIQYKHASKEDIMAFFQEELSKRKLIPRMIAYFKTNEPANQRVRMMVKKDYEAMYTLIASELNSQQNSLKYKLKRVFLTLMDLFE